MGYTLKQAAEAVGITKNALKARLKYLPADAIYTEPKGKQTLTMITDAGMDFLKNPANFPFESAHSKPVAEPFSEPKTDSKTDFTPDKTSFTNKTDFEETETDSRTDFNFGVQMALEALRHQLEEKDRQIEQLQAQLNKTTDALTATAQALASTQESLKAEQMLHAGTIRRELQAGTAADQSEPEQEQELPEQPEEPQKKKKPSWLSWFLG